SPSRATPGGAFDAQNLYAPMVYCYLAGSSFDAGISSALSSQWSLLEAISLGSHCGAACLRGFGPYVGQLARQALPGLASQPPSS
ncbi:MAG: ribokinase, partial [Cyanobacteriota bacterium]